MSDNSAYPRYVRGGPRLFWPGVAIALTHVGLMFVSLMVVFAGRTVVAMGVLALIALAGMRLRCENDEVLLQLNLLVYQADIPIWVHSWQPAHPGDNGPKPLRCARAPSTYRARTDVSRRRTNAANR